MFDELYDTSRDQPVGEGFFSPNGSLTDKELATTLRRYRQRVASSYRAIMPAEISEQLKGSPYLVSPKIDGELWYLVLNGGEAFLANPRGAAVHGELPLLVEARKFASRARGQTIVAGELFALSKAARPRVGDLAAAMAGGKDAQVKRIGFQAFDLLHGGGVEGHESSPMEHYKNRLEAIRALLAGGKRVQAVRTEEVADSAGVKALFEEWVDGGKAEGVVVRAEQTGRIHKVKPCINVDAAVVGYTVRAAEPDQVRSVLLALSRHDRQLQLIGSCGNFGGDEMRRKLLPMLGELEVPSTYRHASSDGSLYRFLRPGTVVEIRITDVQSEDSRGDPIRRMVLEYADESWRGIALMPGVSILHPVFLRLREDKTVNRSDIRVEQVLDRCMVRDATAEAVPIQLEGSEVIRREAWAKTTKDKLAVRKLLVWKTHKDQTQGQQEFPAYVVHWTDYSPGRKAPLQRTVKVAPDKETATAIAEKLVEKGVKRGWKPA